MGLLVIRKNLKKDALDVTQKGPINITIAKKHAVRAKNVFLGVDTNPTLTYIYNMKGRNKLMKKLTKKQTKKIRDQILTDFIDRHMSKFDRLMNKASKELSTMGLKCSIHALSSQMVKHIATNMADYYGTTEKVKDTFQTALDEEVNHRYIHAKAEREEAYIK